MGKVPSGVKTMFRAGWVQQMLNIYKTCVNIEISEWCTGNNDNI